MIISDITKYIHPYNQLLVAFSGGLDSTVLLYQLMLLRINDPNIKLRAIHINHGLSINADKWMTHCKWICAKWNITLLIRHIVLIDKGLGVEGEARKARYAAFQQVLIPGEALVIAQHLNDQIETFMLALKRGSGPTGLSSMAIRTPFANTHILRPLLNVTRTSLLRLAKTQRLSWIEDESNHNSNYDRNFLRLHILPLLMKRWPYFANSVARSALLCAEQESLLNELLIDDLKKIISTNGTINIAPLVSMSAQRRFALLRRWLSMHSALMPSRKMLYRIWNEVAQARKDASPCIYMSGYTIRRFRGQLWWIVNRPSLHDVIVNWPNINYSLILPQRNGYVSLTSPGNIRLPLPNEIVSIRFKANGILHIVGRNRGRKIKKIWQEYNIPPWLRHVIPLLFYNNVLIAAANVFITHDGWTQNGVQLEWKYNFN